MAKKDYTKILIAIAFLIAILPSLVWVHQIWPRYEIRERIVEREKTITLCWLGRDCSDDYRDIETRGEIIQQFCNNATSSICYIKEKIRIN